MVTPSNFTSYIWSPNYPSNYEVNYYQVQSGVCKEDKRVYSVYDLFQEWKLESTNGEPVTLTFERIDIEMQFGWEVCHDWVEINDGNSSQRYCGTSVPGPFTSTGTNMTVKFHSDMGRTGTGFLAVVCCSVNVTTDVNTGTFKLGDIKWVILNHPLALKTCCE